VSNAPPPQKRNPEYATALNIQIFCSETVPVTRISPLSRSVRTRMSTLRYIGMLCYNKAMWWNIVYEILRRSLYISLPAVNYQRSPRIVFLRNLFVDKIHEVHQLSRVLWHYFVRPVGKMKLLHGSASAALHINTRFLPMSISWPCGPYLNRDN